MYDPQFMAVKSENDDATANQDQKVPPNTLKIFQDRKAIYKAEYAHQVSQKSGKEKRDDD